MATSSNPKEQILSGLDSSAAFATIRSDRTTPAPFAQSSPARCPATPSGRWVSFFFDGTGNNLDADRPTREHSNVARLFLVHREDERAGTFRYYVPGIGTYFRDIGDPGGEATGSGAGSRGEERLQWAMKRLDEQLQRSNGQELHLALFGFSRGAALARAFALRVAQRCNRGTEGFWFITLGQRFYRIRLYFMGLFDTVASVGVPMSANNADHLLSGLGSTRFALWDRSKLDLYRLAFGDRPGADPAPGAANGHMAWAKELHIPEMAEDCLHMVAAHELRNSFPVDSVLQGLRYPSNCREMVYPGAHSDVGGGYRPGEGARSRTPGSLLSLLPLRAMRAEALRAGVPLDSGGLHNKDAAFLGEFKGGWKLEAAALKKATEERRRKFVDQAFKAAVLKNSHGANRMQQRIRTEVRSTELAKHDYLSIKARLETLPSSDDSFLDCLKLYDDQLLEDVRLIQRFAELEGRQRLRPYYRAMLGAYEAEQRGQGLREPDILAFFDTYVHDSLAAFAMDATLPSDPRVIYVGRDLKLPFAMRPPRERGWAATALG